MTDRRNQPALPAGLRNNNAGNILLTSIPWVGKVPNNQNTSGVHEQFISSEYGLRALFKQLQSTLKKTDGSLKEFVQKYSGESNTPVSSNYEAVLGQYLGKKTITNSKKDLVNLAKGVIYFENGSPSSIISNTEIEKGWQLLNPTITATPSNPLTKSAFLLLGLLGLLFFSE